MVMNDDNDDWLCFGLSGAVYTGEDHRGTQGR